MDLHRGLHLFAVIAVVCALLIAVINFQAISTRTGRVHRLLGILTPTVFLVQVCRQLDFDYSSVANCQGYLSCEILHHTVRILG